MSLPARLRCPWLVTFLKADRATATAVMARPPPYQASSCSVMSSIPAATRSAAPARLASWRLSLSLRGRSKRSYRERARTAAGQSVRRANLPTGSSMRYLSQSLSEWCRPSRSVPGAARCPGRRDPAAVSADGYCRPPPQRRRVGSSKPRPALFEHRFTRWGAAHWQRPSLLHCDRRDGARVGLAWRLCSGIDRAGAPSGSARSARWRLPLVRAG